MCLLRTGFWSRIIMKNTHRVCGICFNFWINAKYEIYKSTSTSCKWAMGAEHEFTWQIYIIHFIFWTLSFEFQIKNKYSWVSTYLSFYLLVCVYIHNHMLFIYLQISPYITQYLIGAGFSFDFKWSSACNGMQYSNVHWWILG